MIESQLRPLVNDAKRIERINNPAQQRERYLRWRRRAKAVWKVLHDAPPLSWTVERLPDDIAIISGVLDAAGELETPGNPVEATDGAGGSESCAGPAVEVPAGADRTAQRVFVVHGRNHKVRSAMFTFLRSLGLWPLEWSEALAGAQGGAPFIAQVLDEAFGSVGAVVVLITADDEARLRAALLAPADPDYERRLTPQARPNVIFEAGMAFGRHPDKTVLVEVGTGLRPFSDVCGRYVIRMDGSLDRRRELVNQLRSIGCPVNDSGTEWLAAGDFSV